MELIITAILYSVVIINIILGAVILSRGFKNVFNVLFGLMTLAVAAWSFAIVAFYSDSLKYQFNWIAVTHSAALFSALILLYFSILFPRPLIRKKWMLWLPAGLFFVVGYFLFFTHSILGDITGISYEINKGYVYYEILLILFFLFSYFFLIFQYNRSGEFSTKHQLKFILIGSICASVFGMITNLILPALKVFEYTWLGPIFTLVLVVSIFIAIFKYNLFNIKIIITEMVSIALVVLLSIDLFVESNPSLFLIKALVLITVSVFSYILVNSVYREVQYREKIEKLAEDVSKANDQLAKANDRLKELDQLKSEFLSLATHQIKGPLTSIKGYASMVLEGDYGDTPDRIREAVEVIFKSTQNLLTIVRDFLDISRIEQGRIKYEMTDVDAKKLVEDLVAEMRPVIEQAGLFLTYKAVGDGPFGVRADPGKMRQVVGNILDNSMKYTPRGGITVSVETENNRVRINVQDTGIGIDAEDMTKIFGKFIRAKDANKTNVAGTGLGLYVAKQMIQAQGGTISVVSEGPGKGSTFTIEMPLRA